MARPVRVDVAGGWYHVTARGIERRAIFDDVRDHEHFIELIADMSERYGVEIHAYVLMVNHLKPMQLLKKIICQLSRPPVL